MTYTSLRRTQQATDLLATDHLAECPDCHELAHPTATVCEGCGSALFPKNSNGPGRSSLDGTSAAGSERRTITMVKDCTCGDRGLCTACVLAEYDGDLGAHLMVSALDATERALARKPASLHSVRVQDREPTDEEMTRSGPYLMDNRGENHWSL